MTASEADHRTRVPRTVLLLACLVLSACASGCGGSDDGSAASDETTVEETTSERTTKDTTSNATTKETTSKATTKETTSKATTKVVCRVHPDAAAVMYVGWSIWEKLGLGDSEDAKFPEEIKADVETLAGALVEHSGYYSEAYASEDLGFPPEDLAMPPGSRPTDNEIEDFYWARNSVGRELRSLHRIERWARLNCAR